MRRRRRMSASARPTARRWALSSLHGAEPRGVTADAVAAAGCPPLLPQPAATNPSTTTASTRAPVADGGHRQAVRRTATSWPSLAGVRCEPRPRLRAHASSASRCSRKRRSASECDELERAPVRRAGLVDAVEPAQQLGARRVEVVVAVELEAVDQGERRLDVARLGDRGGLGSARRPASRCGARARRRGPRAAASPAARRRAARRSRPAAT